MIANESEFFWVVKGMRQSQKEYFSSRHPIALHDAKAAEKLVDEYIDYRINKLNAQQQGELYSDK
jgi:hypothetical protein